jgi:glycosyltransferase involved in cell wall biosynthesis
MIRVLLSIPDNPFDPTNGAARSVRTICEMLAGQMDFMVTAVCGRGSAGDQFTAQGSAFGHYRGVEYDLIREGYSLDPAFQKQHPDILFTYGITPADRARRDQARQHGCKVVFALRNSNYMEQGLLEPMDGIITPSQWLTDQYRKIGIESTPLPLPMNLEDVIAWKHDPVYVTMVNPAIHKGQLILQTLIEEMNRRRSDIRFQVVTDKAWALRGGIWNLTLHSIEPFPRDIFAQTKILLVPSVFGEPGGRVAVEALLNGIPPIVSDRGALPEVINGAGFVVHIPKEITCETNQPVPVEVVEPWIDVITELWDDPAHYRWQSQQALNAAAMYRPEVLVPRYVEYFRSLGLRIVPSNAPSHRPTSVPTSEPKESR